MSVGSRNSGFAPLTAADIQRAIDLAKPAEEAVFVKQEVAEDQIAPVIPGQGVLQTTVINDIDESKVESSDPTQIPGVMNTSQMLAAAKKSSASASPAATPVGVRDDVARAEASEAKGLAEVAARQTDTLSESFDAFREESRQTDVEFEARIAGLETVQSQLQIQVGNNTSSVLALSGRMKTAEEGITASKNALAAARGDIESLNSRVDDVSENSMWETLWNPIIVVAGAIALFALLIVLLFAKPWKRKSDIVSASQGVNTTEVRRPPAGSRSVPRVDAA